MAVRVDLYVLCALERVYGRVLFRKIQGLCGKVDVLCYDWVYVTADVERLGLGRGICDQCGYVQEIGDGTDWGFSQYTVYEVNTEP